MTEVLIVEDNDLIRNAVSECFAVSGYDVTAAANVHEAERALASHSFEALILDIMLPDGNGYELAQEIRKDRNTPIVFLTAKDSESERIIGFEIGADDYVVKPFSVKELLLRVEAILSRYRTENTESEGTGCEWTLKNRRMLIDRDARRLSVDGCTIHITESEWRILLELSRHHDQAVTRDWIMSECLGRPYDGSERTVDTHIGNLRAALGDEDWIETVRGYGYRFAGKPSE